MKISDENKKQILISVLETVECISDKEYQKRVWIRGEGPECDDIDDTICDFFDEDYILEKYKDFGITKKQYELLKKLQDELRKFANTYSIYSSEKSTKKLISLPQWERIMNLAKEVLKAFDYPKK